MTTTLSMIGLLLAAIQYELKINTEDVDPETYRKSDIVYQTPKTNLLKLIIFMSSLLSLGCMVMREIQKHKLDMILKSDTQSFAGIVNKLLSLNKQIKQERFDFFNRKFIIEALILLIAPIPYFDFHFTSGSKNPGITVTYQLSELLFGLMVFRFYYLIRTILEFSIFQDIYSKQICEFYGFEANFKFTIKTYFFKKSEFSVSILFFSTVCILAYLLRLFEIPYHRKEKSINYGQFDDYYNSVYLMITTITTVGYGDLHPYTNIGRFICLCGCIWGSVVMALVTVTITRIFELSSEQEEALLRIVLMRRAALSITHAVKFYLAKKRRYELQLENDPQIFDKSQFAKLSFKTKKNLFKNLSIKKEYSQLNFETKILQTNNGELQKPLLIENQNNHQDQERDQIFQMYQQQIKEALKKEKQAKNLLDEKVKAFQNESRDLRELKQKRSVSTHEMNIFLQTQVIDLQFKMNKVLEIVQTLRQEQNSSAKLKDQSALFGSNVKHKSGYSEKSDPQSFQQEGGQQEPFKSKKQKPIIKITTNISSDDCLYRAQRKRCNSIN